METFGQSARQNVEKIHPMVEQLAVKGDNEFRHRLELVRNTQGLGNAIHMQMEAKAFSRPLRHPCMSQQPFHLGRDVVLGKDTEIDFEDYLSPQAYREVSKVRFD